MAYPNKARKLANELLEKHGKIRSWREVAKGCDGKINFATLSRFANSFGEWIPKSPQIRLALGLPAVMPAERPPRRPRTCDPASPCRGCKMLKEYREKRK